MKISRIVWLIGSLVLVVVGCQTAEVKDFKSWCLWVHEENKEDYVFDFQREAVLQDLVQQWDRIITENSAQWLGVERKEAATDWSIAEAKRLRLMGAWQDGNSLFFSFELMPTLEGVSFPDDFEKRVTGYAKGLKAVQEGSGNELGDRTTYCLYLGIDVFFEKLVLLGPDNQEKVLKTKAFKMLEKYEGRGVDGALEEVYRSRKGEQ